MNRTKSLIENLPSVSFFNEHIEKFTIHSNGIFVFMSGDEVDAMVDDKNKVEGKYIQLFNSAFSVWSKEELHKLGKALQELMETS